MKRRLTVPRDFSGQPALRRNAVLDTSKLIDGYVNGRKRQRTPAEAARDLILVEQCGSVLRLVVIEFLVGSRSELEHAEHAEFLSVFEVIDDGSLTSRDFEVAEQFARRVPRDGKPRQAMDCLIKAVAFRLKRQVLTKDKTFGGRRASGDPRR